MSEVKTSCRNTISRACVVLMLSAATGCASTPDTGTRARLAAAAPPLPELRMPLLANGKPSAAPVPRLTHRQIAMPTRVACSFEGPTRTSVKLRVSPRGPVYGRFSQVVLLRAVVPQSAPGRAGDSGVYVEVSSASVRLRGWVDASSLELFAQDTVRLAGHVVPLPDTPLSLVASHDGELTVGAQQVVRTGRRDSLMPHLTLSTPPHARVACNNIGLSESRPMSEFSSIPSRGFEDARAVELPAHEVLRLSTTAGAPITVGVSPSLSDSQPPPPGQAAPTQRLLLLAERPDAQLLALPFGPYWVVGWRRGHTPATQPFYYPLNTPRNLNEREVFHDDALTLDLRRSGSCLWPGPLTVEADGELFEVGEVARRRPGMMITGLRDGWMSIATRPRRSPNPQVRYWVLANRIYPCRLGAVAG